MTHQFDGNSFNDLLISDMTGMLTKDTTSSVGVIIYSRTGIMPEATYTSGIQMESSTDKSNIPTNAHPKVSQRNRLRVASHTDDSDYIENKQPKLIANKVVVPGSDDSDNIEN